MEHWFHSIPILVPLVICITLLATNSYNGNPGGVCYTFPHDPPHCIGYEAGAIPEGYSIPCGRGGESDGQTELRTITWWITCFWMLIIAPVTILVTMASMFRSVANIEKQMENYGVRALRFRTTFPAAPTTDNSTGQQEGRSFAFKLKEMIGKYLCLTADLFTICCVRCHCACDAGCWCSDPKRPSPTTKSNKMTCQKRAVLYMAFGYAGAWLLVWSPYFVCVVFWIVTNAHTPDTLAILMCCTVPLQGFFSFLVFMAPKARTTRTLAMRRERNSYNNNYNHNQQQHLTWCQAFYKAYVSRGRRLKDRNMRNTNRTERRTSTRAIVRKINETIQSRRTSARTSSPEITETNECCLESGVRSAAASPS